MNHLFDVDSSIRLRFCTETLHAAGLPSFGSGRQNSQSAFDVDAHSTNVPRRSRNQPGARRFTHHAQRTEERDASVHPSAPRRPFAHSYGDGWQPADGRHSRKGLRNDWPHSANHPGGGGHYSRIHSRSPTSSSSLHRSVGRAGIHQRNGLHLFLHFLRETRLNYLFSKWNADEETARRAQWQLLFRNGRAELWTTPHSRSRPSRPMHPQGKSVCTNGSWTQATPNRVSSETWVNWTYLK